MKTLAKISCAVVALCGCGGTKDYLESVTKYADAASEGTASLGEVPSTMSETCHERAVAGYLKYQLASEPVSGTWPSYYGHTGEADSVLSWDEYCAEIVKTSDHFSTLVALLDAYSKAMKQLATAGGWDGQPFNDLVSGIGTLAGSKTPAGKTLDALAPAAQSLGKLVVAAYAERKAHDFAAEANTPVQAILDGLKKYLVAVEHDLVQPMAKDRREVVALLETKASVWAPTKDASRILSFVEYARATDRANLEAVAAIENAQQLIDDLKDGQTRLANAPANKAGAAEILSAATDILIKLNELKAAQEKDKSSEG